MIGFLIGLGLLHRQSAAASRAAILLREDGGALLLEDGGALLMEG